MIDSKLKGLIVNQTFPVAYTGNRTFPLFETLTNATTNTPYLYPTNIGNSGAPGVEAYFEVSLWRLLTGTRSLFDLKLFNSFSYDHARYNTGSINNNGEKHGGQSCRRGTGLDKQNGPDCEAGAR